MENKIRRGIFYALLAAALYAINAPFSKLLLDFVPPTLTAGLLYVGAGVGMGAILLFRRVSGAAANGERFSKGDARYVFLMIILDVAAPICLMLGLSRTSAANASLLNNFEIVATAMIALVIFGEKISKRLWLGIASVTLSCLLLSFEDASSLTFSLGSLFVLLAALLWGLENNCTRKLSSKDPLVIVVLKGFFSGSTSLIIGLLLGERASSLAAIIAVLAVGFVAYGMSIFYYVHAQRRLGAARTGAYYAIAPFVSAILSLMIFRELPPPTYFIALIIMAIGAWLCSKE